MLNKLSQSFLMLLVLGMALSEAHAVCGDGPPREGRMTLEMLRSACENPFVPRNALPPALERALERAGVAAASQPRVLRHCEQHSMAWRIGFRNKLRLALATRSLEVEAVLHVRNREVLTYEESDPVYFVFVRDAYNAEIEFIRAQVDDLTWAALERTLIPVT